MNHWDILGIAKTNDQKIIRKAYAIALKTIDQELEPEKFIALRTAFESAKDEANTPDYLLPAEDRPENQLSPVNSIEIESVSSQDQSLHIPQEAIPLHQRGFEFLLKGIEQQNSTIDLRTELRDYTDYILNLEPDILSNEQAQIYLQQLHNACIAADLNGLNDFLNLTLDQDLARLDSSPDSVVDSQTTLLNPAIHFKDQLDALSQQLWEENFTDQAFEQFRQLLEQWQYQTLDHQMAAYDQLNHVLGSINSTTSEPNRFFELWYQHFGNEMPPASADPASHRLYDRLEDLVNQHEFWQQIPDQYVKSLQTLQTSKAFRPLQVLKLLLSVNSTIQSLRQNNWSGIPGMIEPERNINLYFLRLWTLWIRNFSIQLMFSILCILVTGGLFEIKTSITFGIFLPLSFVYFPVIVSPALAKGFASAQRDIIFSRLTTLFYFSIIMLALLSPLINTTIISILLSAWAILATFIIGYALYFYRSIFDDLKETLHIQADKFFVYLGFCLAIMLTGFIISKAQNIDPFGILFALLPISLILCPDYFKDFFNAFFKRPGDFIISLLALFKSSGLVIGVVALYATLSLMAGSADAKALPDYINLPLALMLATSFWLAFLSGKGISYICKYLTYFIMIVVSIKTIVLPLLFSFYLYRTAKVDRQLKQAKA